MKRIVVLYTQPLNKIPIFSSKHKGQSKGYKKMEKKSLPKNPKNLDQFSKLNEFVNIGNLGNGGGGGLSI
jgi:hypothetical protein